MSEYLKDKVVLITGSGGGFGRLIAEKCAVARAKVVGIDVNGKGLEETFSGIASAGYDGMFHVADVTDLDQLKAVVAKAVDTYGAMDVVVNNAGVMPLAYFSDHAQAWEKWHKAIDINIKGVLNGMIAVYDQMISQGRGHVVNISSIYGNAGIEGSGVYSATKAAVAILSDSLRTEAKGKIKVTTVKPTGVLGTNLGSWIVNDSAIVGLVGQRAEQYTKNVEAAINGTLSPEQTDPNSPQYWLIKPDDLAGVVVQVIDQPWGISLSDVTVRASGEDYIY